MINTDINKICENKQFFEYPVLEAQLKEAKNLNQEIIYNPDLLKERQFHTNGFRRLFEKLIIKIQQLWHSIRMGSSKSYKDSFNSAVDRIIDAKQSHENNLALEALKATEAAQALQEQNALEIQQALAAEEAKKQAVTTLQASLISNQIALKELEQKSQGSQTELSALQTQEKEKFSGQNITLESLATQQAALLIKKQTLESKCKKLEQQIEDDFIVFLLKMKLKDKRASLSKIDGTLAAIKSTMSDVADLQSKIATATNTIAEQSAQIERLSTAVATITQQLKDLQVEEKEEQTPVPVLAEDTTPEEVVIAEPEQIVETPVIVEAPPTPQYDEFIRLINAGTQNEKIGTLLKALFDNIEDVEGKIEKVTPSANGLTIKLKNDLFIWTPSNANPNGNGTIVKINRTVSFNWSKDTIKFSEANNNGLDLVEPISAKIIALKFEKIEGVDAIVMTGKKWGISKDIPETYECLMNFWKNQSGQIPNKINNDLNKARDAVLAAKQAI